jgi:hypothetical protein
MESEERKSTGSEPAHFLFRSIWQILQESREGDVPTVEQPKSAQKFSAQELLEALRPVKITKRSCEPFGLLESGHRVMLWRRTGRKSSAGPHFCGEEDDGERRRWELSIVTVFETEDEN